MTVRLIEIDHSFLDAVYEKNCCSWSYGVLLFEILSLGAAPYAHVPIREMFRHLEAGHRQEMPHCHRSVFVELCLV